MVAGMGSSILVVFVSELCMLAERLAVAGQRWLGDMFVSEKIDGMRAIWDGGVTRGWKKSDVPWADCRSDDRYREVQYSTGLWTRLGGVIHAPGWWLDKLPAIVLDMELYNRELIFSTRYGRLCSGVGMAGGDRQDLFSIVKQLVPGPEWNTVKAIVLDTIPWDVLTEPRSIGVGKKARCWGHWGREGRIGASVGVEAEFESRLKWLAGKCGTLLPQEKLDIVGWEQRVNWLLECCVSMGGEGLVVKGGKYVCKRVPWMLKLKGMDDDEGTVIGITAGKGRLGGKIGALVVKWGSVTFELAGLTDAERSLGSPAWMGKVVTFKYRGLTKDGLPVEARYWRQRES